MGRGEVPVEARNDKVGIDELDAVIATEMPALVIPPVVAALGVALVRIDNERLLALGELAVGDDVDAFVSHKPEAGFLTLAWSGAVIGIAKAAIGGRVLFPARDNLAHRLM